jgi:hypothetical protein
MAENMGTFISYPATNIPRQNSASHVSCGGALEIKLSSKLSSSISWSVICLFFRIAAMVEAMMTLQEIKAQFKNRVSL